MSNDSNLTKELIEKIYQFIQYQIENNRDLPESSRESLTVASECIQQSFQIDKKPASADLLDILRSHRQQQQSPLSGQTMRDLQQNPVAFIQNLATNFFSEAPATSQSEAAQATSSGSETFSSQPRVRKQASESEKLAAESFKNQGNDYMRSDDFKEAYESYSRAIEIDDNNAIYYSNRAAASSKLGNHQAALEDCKEAISIDPNYSKAYGRMGLAYATLGNHQKAKESYLKAVELDPTNESYQNNLNIAEEKLNEQSTSSNPMGGIDPVSMFRSMMSNPEAMQMAMRTLQMVEPRLQSFLNPGGSSTNTNPSQGPNPQQDHNR